jgi:hypothetical protein
MPKLVSFENADEGLPFVAKHIGIINDPGLLNFFHYYIHFLFLIGVPALRGPPSAFPQSI